MLTPVADGIMAHEVTPFEYTDNTRAYVMAIFVDASDDCARGYVQYASQNGTLHGAWLCLPNGDARDFLAVVYRIERFMTTNRNQPFGICVHTSMRHERNSMFSVYDVSPEYEWKEI